jgi:L-alanine-DL-glutamate epimerase-like enolase superfamily enzyme
MRISAAYTAYENEPLKTAFGFKGNALSYLTQSVVCLGDGEHFGIGVGVQSVLWSDAEVFSTFGEDRGNEFMYSVTKHAAKLLCGREFFTPQDAIFAVIPECLDYARRITGVDVKQTFVLNALVPVDMALWMMYVKTNKLECFDDIYKGNVRNTMLANIPLITYNSDIADVVEMARNGTCIFKIKIGSDPDKNGDRDRMLAWDKARAKAVHNALSGIRTPYTESGRPVYYFDANGRYDTKERLLDFIDFLRQEQILENTVLFEEPFAEENKIYVGDIPCTFAADESAHSIEDVKERIELGYKAITLKPIAKTLSVTMKMAEYAEKMGVQCFCADLTVNPLMLEWNKNVAARLSPLRGMKIGVVESNGAQNYVNWNEMCRYAGERDDKVSFYELTDNFFSSSDIFETRDHYLKLIKQQNDYVEGL